MTETMEHPTDAVAARLASFSDQLVEITRERSALDAREARLLAEAAAYADATSGDVMARSTTRTDGRTMARRSLCASLAMAVRASEPTMQRRISDAEALVHRAPTVLAALGEGSITEMHARVVTDQLRDVPEACRSSFLEQVLPLAQRSTAARLKQRARVLREHLHPESIAVRTARSVADRRVELEPAADGMAWVHLFSSASIAHGIMNRLDAIAERARDHDGDSRTLAQLRADALSALGIAGAASLEDVATSVEDGIVANPIAVEASIRATVQVTVPVLTLLGVDDQPGTLDGYGPIDAETAARLAISAPSMTRLLTHPETGAILSVGREQYRVPADLQRVIRLRDVTCRAPGCNRRARACDLDHCVAWQDDGVTSADNLACLCRHHHRMKHQPDWNLEPHPGGILTWTTPDGREHTTMPELAGVG